MLDNIKKLRQEFGLSQSALAEQLGVSQQSVNKYENHNIEPDIRTLALMAEVFGTTVDYIIGRSNDRTPLSHATPELTADERLLLQDYRKLKPPQKKAVQTVIESYQ